MSTTQVSQISIDHNVSRQTAERMIEEKGFGVVGAAILQDVRNSGATRCSITLLNLERQPLALVIVKDDGRGYRDFAAMREMLAPTCDGAGHIDDGGAGLAVALCRTAAITSKCGMVNFDGDDCYESAEFQVPIGSMFTGLLECNDQQFALLQSTLNSPALPEGLILTLNHRAVVHRTPIHTFELPTALPGAGQCEEQRCTVELYEPEPDETVGLFEQGVMVQETGDKWHYNVLGSVPRSWSAESDTWFLRCLRSAVLAEMVDKLVSGDSQSNWVLRTVSDENCPAGVFVWWLHARLGDKVVKSSVQSSEADRRAAEHGYAVVEPGHLTVGQHLNMARFCDVPDSIEVFDDDGDPHHRTVSGLPKPDWDSDAPDGFVKVDVDLLELVPDEECTRRMRAVAEYARGLAYHLLAEPLTLRFVRDPGAHPLNGADCWFRSSDEGTELFFPVTDSGESELLSAEELGLDALLLKTFETYEKNALREVYGGLVAVETPYGALMKQAALLYPEWISSISAQLR